MNMQKEVFDISLNDIVPNRFQPREIFNEDSLQELANSIKEHGVIEPIIVRKIGEKFEIIAGERRFRASKIAGKETIPAIVKNIDDKETAKIALLENLQRQNLTPIEEAKTYQTILKLENITQEELAKSLGKSQASIANKLRLLNLDESVQIALLNSKISERHARSLLNISDKVKQREMLNRVVLERMTVRKLDEEISDLLGISVDTADNSVEDSLLNEAIENDLNSIPNSNKAYQVENDTPKPVFGLPPIMSQEKVQEELKQDNKQELNFNNFENKTFDAKPSNNIVIEDTQKKAQPVTNNDLLNNNQINPFDQVRENQTFYGVESAKKDIHDVINKIQQNGISVQKEEFDFENVYQMVIKIDKNK